jgi:hypothetical protein
MHVLAAVEERLAELDAKVGGEDPRTLLSRIAANAFWTRAPSHERAVTLAATALLLVAAIERAETADITSGEAA